VSDGAPALEMSGVDAAYGARPALSGIDLTLAPGDLLALLGPNGAGKSTLVALAAGLREPAAGTVRVCGRDPRRDRATRRLVGLAAQEIGLYPALTVRQNLRAMGEIHGMSAVAARTAAESLLAPFGLDAVAGRAAGDLSGGERRRAHAAAALVHGPRLALLDEPTAGADPRTRDAILSAVRDLAAGGVAVVYTTHYLPEVEARGGARRGGRPAVRAGGAPRRGRAPVVVRRPRPGVARVGGRWDRRRGRGAPARRRSRGGAGGGAGAPGWRHGPPDGSRDRAPHAGGRLHGADGPPRPGRRVRGAVAIARTEVRLLRHDPVPAVVLIGMPVVLMTLLSPALRAALLVEGDDVPGSAQSVPGMACVFAVFAAGIVGFAIFRDHGWHTWERLHASGVPAREVMAGKLVVPAALLATQAVVLFTVGVLLLDLRVPGSWLVVVAVAAAYGVLVLAAGLAVAAFASTIQQVNALTALGAMVLGGLGGGFVPADSLPEWVQPIAPASPVYWAMEGYRGAIIDGEGLAAAALPLAVLLSVAAALAALAAGRLRRDTPKRAWG